MPGAVESVRNVTFLGHVVFWGTGKIVTNLIFQSAKDFFQSVFPKKPVTHKQERNGSSYSRIDPHENQATRKGPQRCMRQSDNQAAHQRSNRARVDRKNEATRALKHRRGM